MSKQYNLYLKEHKGDVAKGYYWIREHLPELINNNKVFMESILEQQICFEHDESKSDPNEYVAYDNYFYGGIRSEAVKKDFNYAWLRHIHRNPHHWQHWVLINDDPNEGEIIMDMEYRYILEMICDWWAFSWSKGDLREIFKWYDEHKDYMKLSKMTRKTVEDILSKIEKKIDELEKRD